jgi:uncharacterized protein (DUF983 family)
MAGFWKSLAALLSQRCPSCLTGRIFGERKRMNVRCPNCGMLFEREQGYFLGAMYVSYTLATLFLGLFTFLVYLLFPSIDLGVAVLIAAGLFVPFVPGVTRYSRVVWIYFDRWAWTDQSPPVQ